MKIKSLKWNKYSLSLFLVILFNINYLYFLDANWKIMGIYLSDIALFFAIIWGIFSMFPIRMKVAVKSGIGKWILAIIVIALVSGLQANRLFGQSFYRSISPQRRFLVWMFMYFPIIKCIRRGKISKNSFKRIFGLVAILQTVVYFAQFLMQFVIRFCQVYITFKGGFYRFYFGDLFLIILYFFALDYVLNKDSGYKKWAYIYIGVFLILEVFCMRTRLTILALMLCTGVNLLVRKNNPNRKLLHLLVGVFAAGLLMSTEIVQNAIQTILNQDWDAGMLIRFDGKAIYMDMLKRHPILGVGYPNMYNAAAYFASNHGDERIILQDNGWMGFMYIYGGVGLIWLITFFIHIAKKGCAIYKKTRRLGYIMLPFFFVVVSYDGLPFYWGFGPVAFCMYLCILQVDYVEVATTKPLRIFPRLEIIGNMNSMVDPNMSVKPK